MRYALADWVKKLDFWLDEDTPTKIAGAEAPPTSYGKTNAREDLSETVMLYFVDRKSTCRTATARRREIPATRARSGTP